jgi:hypothetical protein
VAGGAAEDVDPAGRERGGREQLLAALGAGLLAAAARGQGEEEQMRVYLHDASGM